MIRDRLRAWWRRNIVADQATSERLSCIDVELHAREEAAAAYIVTTKRPTREIRWPETTAVLGYELLPESVSRRAVATLEGRHLDPLWREAGIDPRYWNEATVSCLRLPSSGGTVGPLPDGTVIEVAPVTEDQLRAAVAYVFAGAYRKPLAEVIDAYNALK